MVIGNCRFCLPCRSYTRVAYHEIVFFKSQILVCRSHSIKPFQWASLHAFTARSMPAKYRIRTAASLTFSHSLPSTHAFASRSFSSIKTTERLASWRVSDLVRRTYVRWSPKYELLPLRLQSSLYPLYDPWPGIWIPCLLFYRFRWSGGHYGPRCIQGVTEGLKDLGTLHLYATKVLGLELVFPKWYSQSRSMEINIKETHGTLGGPRIWMTDSLGFTKPTF